MANNPSPNAENYTLGRGYVLFAQNDSGGNPTVAELDLGNTPEFNVSVDVEVLEHFTSRSGLRAKDKKVVSQITPRITFTLDEFNVENIKLAFMANSAPVTQVRDDDDTFTINSHIKGRTYDVGARNIGILVLNYDGLTGTFQRADVITGGTSGATADVAHVEGTTELWITNVGGTPPFVDGETITGSVSLATASVDTAGRTLDATSGAVFSTEKLVVLEGGTELVRNTDFAIKDSRAGLVEILTTSTATASANLDVEFFSAATNYTKIDGFEQSTVEGFLRFVPDVPVGTNVEIKMWQVALNPTGDNAFIGDDFAVMSFEGEILKDESGHPDSPFMDVILETPA